MSVRLDNLTATAHPAGNRIDLRWKHLDGAMRVVVVRREKAFPTSPMDGSRIADGQGVGVVSDCGLRGETVYYYTLFLYHPDGTYEFGDHTRIAAMATAPYDMAGQMYELLPRIYQRYDTIPAPSLPADCPEADRQKGALRRFLELPGSQLDQLYSLARAALNLHDPDTVDGRLLPLLAQWIGWETNRQQEIDAQRNELRNAPFLYQTIGIIPAVEATVKRVLGWDSRTKEFVDNVFVSNRPEQLNLWICRHDAKGTWSDSSAPLSLNMAYAGRPTAVRDAEETLWLFYHTVKQGGSEIWYKTLRSKNAWSPSRPLGRRGGIDKHPTAARQGSTLWVFWETYDEQRGTWRIDYTSSHDDGQTWADAAVFGNSQIRRRRPWAIVDQAGGLWLFWLEWVDGAWQLTYTWHDGMAWAAESARFPQDNGIDPQLTDDFFVLFHATNTAGQIWVFWTRKEPVPQAANTPPNQTRWRVAYRVKQTSDSVSANDWGDVTLLSAADDRSSDREPAARVDEQGNVELFWSANRSGNWAIWRATLPAGSPKAITNGPYVERYPLPIEDGAEMLLVYRSNQGPTYRSQIYPATKTVDLRAAGSTTVDTRNVTKLGLRGQFEDVQTYTYDTGRNGVRNNTNWYARDTVGIYLRPGTDDPRLIRRNQHLIAQALRRFLPIQVRVVFIIDPIIYPERIYTYDVPREEAQRLIVERFGDRLTSPIADVYDGLADTYTDRVPGWVWMHAWSEAFRDQHTVDFRTAPIKTTVRTWHTGLEEEE